MVRQNPDAAATALLASCDCNQAPVPVDKIADHIGAQVVRQRMDAHLSGMTFRQDDVVLIGINSGHHPRRQRFTMAHEIGHVVLHPGKPLLVDSSVRVNFRNDVSSLATNQEEIEANAFAAELLMPRDLVWQHYTAAVEGGTRGRDPLVALLARTFDVSTEAMGYRLINLGLVGA